MPALTPAQLEEFRKKNGLKHPAAVAIADATSKIHASQEAPPEPYRPSFPYDPSGTNEAGLLNTLRMIGNVPGSGLEMAKSAYAAGSHPIDTALKVGGVIAGSGHEAGRRFLGTPDTENAQEFRQAGGNLLDMLKNPGRTLVEDPVGVATMAAGAIGPAARMAGLSKIAGAADAFNPIGVSLDAAGAVATKGPELLRKGFAQAGKVSTGRSAGALNDIFEVGKSGNKRAISQATNAMRKPGIAIEKMGQDFIKALEDLKDERASVYQAQAPTWTWKDPSAPFDLDAFKRDIIAKMVGEHKVKPLFNPQTTGPGLGPVIDFDFKGSPISLPTQQNKMKMVVNDIMTWDDNTPQGLDILKRRIGNAIDPAEDSQGTKAFISGIKADLRKGMGEKIQNYNETMKDIEAASDILDEAKAVMGTASDNPETVINKITAILKDTPNMALRRRVAKDISAISGNDFLAQAAGLDLSQAIGSGLVGRNMLWAGPALAAGTGEMSSLYAMPFTSPRAMGELMLALGKTSGQVRKITDFMRDLHSQIPPGVSVEGLTVGAVLDHLDRHGVKVESRKRIVGKAAAAP